MTHAALATHLLPGTTAQDIALWERGAKSIPVSQTEMLSRALGIDETPTVADTPDAPLETPEILSLLPYLLDAEQTQPLLKRYQTLVADLNPKQKQLLDLRMARMSKARRSLSFGEARNQVNSALKPLLENDLWLLLLLAPDEALEQMPALAQSLRDHQTEEKS